MGKGNGTSRSSSSSSPRGLKAGEMPNTPERGYAPPASERLRNLEDIAERFYANGELKVDPGDAVFEAARYMRSDQIGDSIDNLTDYYAMPEVARGGAITGVTLMPKNYESSELISDYGADSFRIQLESQSLMEIISELRSSSMSSLFRKYR